VTGGDKKKARRNDLVVVCHGMNGDEPTHTRRVLCAIFISEHPSPGRPFVDLRNPDPRRDRGSQLGNVRRNGQAESFYVESEGRWRHRIECLWPTCTLSPTLRDERLLDVARKARAAGRVEIELVDLATL
jgi:hypothetical protein